MQIGYPKYRKYVSKIRIADAYFWEKPTFGAEIDCKLETMNFVENRADKSANRHMTWAHCLADYWSVDLFNLNPLTPYFPVHFDYWMRSDTTQWVCISTLVSNAHKKWRETFQKWFGSNKLMREWHMHMCSSLVSILCINHLYIYFLFSNVSDEWSLNGKNMTKMHHRKFFFKKLECINKIEYHRIIANCTSWVNNIDRQYKESSSNTLFSQLKTVKGVNAIP